jgi:hypothetical protein
LDRSEEGFRRTLDRMNIPHDAIPFFCPNDDSTLVSINQILHAARKHSPEARLFVIEGIGAKVSNGKVSDYAEVATFLVNLGKWCKSENSTIIGVVHAAKTKANEGYDNPRQRILGSVAWGSHSETIIGIEPIEAKDPNCALRRIYILPRNAPEQTIDMEFRGGVLIPAEAETIAGSTGKRKGRPNNELHEAIDEIQCAFKIHHILEFSVAELHKLLPRISLRTLQRAVKELSAVGQARSLSRGRYQAISPFNDPLCPDWEDLPPDPRKN